MCPTGIDNLLAKRLGRTFPEERVVIAGESPEIPESQSERNPGDGRPVWTACAKKLPGFIQTLYAKILLGRDAVTPMKRGSESPFGHPGLLGQFRDGKRLIGAAHGQFQGGLREDTPTIKVSSIDMLAECEEFASLREQFIPTGIHRNGAVQHLRLGFGRRKDTVNQRRESSRHLGRRLQELRSSEGCELQLWCRWKQEAGWNMNGEPFVTWFASQANSPPGMTAKTSSLFRTCPLAQPGCDWK